MSVRSAAASAASASSAAARPASFLRGDRDNGNHGKAYSHAAQGDNLLWHGHGTDCAQLAPPLPPAPAPPPPGPRRFCGARVLARLSYRQRRDTTLYMAWDMTRIALDPQVCKKCGHARTLWNLLLCKARGDLTATVEAVSCCRVVGAAKSGPPYKKFF